MKLYKVTYAPHGGGQTQTYAGTQKDAKKLQQAQEGKYGRFNVDDWVEVYVPTDKAGLLKFLNGEPE